MLSDKTREKHAKFDSLWIVPFVIAQVHKNNTFKLQSLEGEEVFDGPVNRRFLKLYFICGSEALLL